MSSKTMEVQEEVHQQIKGKDKDQEENHHHYYRCDKVNAAMPLLQQEEDSFINELPDEILEFIFTHLPPYGDLKSCEMVCKRWNDVVNNLIRRSKLNLENGLIDFRLRWDIFSQDSGTAAASANGSGSDVAITKLSMINQQLIHQQPVPVIAGRFAHSAVRHGNHMYIFGGGSSSDTTFNDLWRFDMTRMSWERPISMGTYPSPKGSASMVSWRNQLILFGGWRYPSLHPPYQSWCLFDELHYYDLSENRWIARTTLHSPPPMACHSATVHGDRMVIFGGYQIKSDRNINSNDTWVLDLYEQYWSQPLFCGNTRPSPRYGQIQVVIDEHHLLIVGGCGGANRLYSDAWLLDMTRDVWVWREIPVRNKKFGALHMWCNPACKINSYLVVVGPTPNMPSDFQMIKQSRMPGGNGGVGVGAGGVAGAGQVAENARYGILGQPPPPALPNPGQRQQLVAANALRLPNQQNQRLDNQQNNRLGAQDVGGNGINNGGGQYYGPDAQYLVNRREILNRHQQAANNFAHNNNVNNNNNQQPRTGRLADLRASPPPAAVVPPPEQNDDNRPSSSSSPSNTVRNNSNEAAEAAHRLQRNLALRCRDNEPLLPKRFDEVYEDPFRMAAFNVTNRSRSSSRDHNERIRRMEEKMNALRNSRRNIAAVATHKEPIKEPSPKRIRRNVQSLFVCDLSRVKHATDPYLEWVEYKNYGVVPGAPDRLILSSLIAGNGELILFGGVHKETLSGITHHVSNSVHFLHAPRDIV